MDTHESNAINGITIRLTDPKIDSSLLYFLDYALPVVDFERLIIFGKVNK